MSSQKALNPIDSGEWVSAMIHSQSDNAQWRAIGLGADITWQKKIQGHWATWLGDAPADVVASFSENPKYQHTVKEVHLLRAEGSGDTNNKYILPSYEAANALLSEWSKTAPSGGGYDKCDFMVVFNDEESTEYNGTYGLRHFSCKQEEGDSINLSKRIRDFCEFSAGLESARPEWMSDKNWQDSLDRGADSAKEYVYFLEAFDV